MQMCIFRDSSYSRNFTKSCSAIQYLGKQGQNINTFSVIILPDVGHSHDKPEWWLKCSIYSAGIENAEALMYFCV